MFIKKLYIKNFKSFKEQEIELGNFNVLIGANASGKSNFVQVFEFLKSLPEENLSSAISLQGGFDYLRNLRLSKEEEIKIKIEGELEASKLKESYIFFNVNFNKYQIIRNPLVSYEISFSKTNGLLNFYEGLNFYVGFKELKETSDGINGEQIELKINLFNINKDLSLEVSSLSEEKISSKKIKLKIEEVLGLFKAKSETILLLLLNLLEAPGAFPFNIAKYDFDPKIIKMGGPVKSKTRLDENGKNLFVILKELLEREEEKQRFFMLIKFILPFIQNFDFEISSYTNSVMMKIKEIFLPENYLPAYFISDGTINILAFIIALYFEEDRIQIFEEPEKNIHPYLISKVIEMMKDVSKRKQIIVTTHNPEVVKYAGIENLLLIYRNKNGFSEITRPAEKKELKIFLENQIGLDELFVQNLLEL